MSVPDMRYLNLPQAEQHIEMLEAQLVALEHEPVKVPVWGGGFSTREIILIQALVNVFPNYLTLHQLNDIVPKRDHAADRGEKTICVMANHIRRKVGYAAIVVVRGAGYKLGADFFTSLMHPRD